MDAHLDKPPGPTFKDWLLLAINVVFVAMGVVIVPSDRNTGITTLAFFGSCLVISAGIVWSKLWRRNFRAQAVRVVGGVPIRPKRAPVVLAGAWLLGLGVILVVFGGDAPVLIRIIFAVIALVGFALLAGAATGLWPAGHLQFDPKTFTIAYRGWSACIPWDAITGISEADFHASPMLLIGVSDVSRIGFGSEEARRKGIKAIAQCRASFGTDFAIMTLHFGVDLPVLAASVRRYAEDGHARRELAQRRL